MNNTFHDITERLLKSGRELTTAEKRVTERLFKREHVSVNTNEKFLGELTFGQRLADRIASFGGSWTFIILFMSVLTGWVLLNIILVASHGSTFDPYPFILLNLFLSMLAALQAPVIMMSQNRQSAKDRLQADHDYEVNLKAEMEILALHQKIDDLRNRQWEELLAIQRDQVDLLKSVLAKAAGAGATA